MATREARIAHGIARGILLIVFVAVAGGAAFELVREVMRGLVFGLTGNFFSDQVEHVANRAGIAAGVCLVSTIFALVAAFTQPPAPRPPQ